jgi:hypothetical protein
MSAIARSPRASLDARRIVLVSLTLLMTASLSLRAAVAEVAAVPAPAEALARQAREYEAAAPKTVLELQQFRRSDTVAAVDGKDRAGTATLVNINPRINAWFLLTLEWGPRGERVSYHLENAKPQTQTIELAGPNGQGVRISAAGNSLSCDLWLGNGASPLERAKRSGLPYAPLCDGRLYLRNRVSGSRTTLEGVTDFLRDNVWGGETIVQFVKREFYRDRFLEKGAAGTAPPESAGESAREDWPRAASLRVAPGDRIAVPDDLGIDLGRKTETLAPGRWYPVSGISGVYLSFVQPQTIDPEILASYRTLVNPLDSVEADGLVYLIAFDLAQFDLGFALGTDHPRVGWSERPPANMRDRSLPGPDGIGTIAPLVSNGMVSPALTAKTVATFTGGFKRQHGAFRYGPYAERNHGTHYGFIEQGAVLSKLLPGLATLYVLDDGTVGMKTWSVEDDALLPRIRHARQNGVAIVEYDPHANASAPGPLVARWGPGNWSGSADEKLRTLRAGACLQQTATHRFLVYGYFSSATPSAMARVFQAYACRYAMLLDMNALEHTYLALYVHVSSEIVVQHLVQGMAQVDKKSGSGVLPRFLGFPDDRDFFYLTQREQTR